MATGPLWAGLSYAESSLTKPIPTQLTHLKAKKTEDLSYKKIVPKCPSCPHHHQPCFLHPFFEDTCIRSPTISGETGQVSTTQQCHAPPSNGGRAALTPPCRAPPAVSHSSSALRLLPVDKQPILEGDGPPRQL